MRTLSTDGYERLAGLLDPTPGPLQGQPGCQPLPLRPLPLQSELVAQPQRLPSLRAAEQDEPARLPIAIPRNRDRDPPPRPAALPSPSKHTRDSRRSQDSAKGTRTQSATKSQSRPRPASTTTRPRFPHTDTRHGILKTSSTYFNSSTTDYQLSRSSARPSLHTEQSRRWEQAVVSSSNEKRTASTERSCRRSHPYTAVSTVRHQSPQPATNYAEVLRRNTGLVHQVEGRLTELVRLSAQADIDTLQRVLRRPREE